MITSPLFSIVIPLYNKEEYIQRTLMGVLNQSFQDFEIVIINDGSTDNSLEIVLQTLVNFENKTIISKKNKGLSASRNLGIKKSRGSIIALLDADDYWKPGFLESIKYLYITFPEASFYGTDYIEKHHEKIELEPKKNIPLAKKDTSFLISDFFEANLNQNIICQSSMAFKKEISETIKYDEKINFAEDIDFYIRSFSKYKLAYDYSALAVINFGVPNQITKIGIHNKVIPNLNHYNALAVHNISLKRYLDFYRYCFASLYKQNGNKNEFEKIIATINYDHLNFKQKLLLQLPRFILLSAIAIKKWFLKYSIRISSYSFLLI